MTNTARVALVLLAVTLALLSALPAGAKGNVKATLTALPAEAPPGSEVKVAWKLFYLGHNGQPEPVPLSGLFVRLVSASGDSAEEGHSSNGASLTGDYEVTVRVPKGGIGGIEIGYLQSSAGKGSHVLFPITNDPFVGAAARSTDGEGRTSSDGHGISFAATLALGLALLLFALGAVLAVKGRLRSLLRRPLASRL